jgi:hypothetical protein
MRSQGQGALHSTMLGPNRSRISKPSPEPMTRARFLGAAFPTSARRCPRPQRGRNDFALSKPLETGRVSVRQAFICRMPAEIGR